MFGRLFRNVVSIKNIYTKSTVSYKNYATDLSKSFIPSQILNPKRNKPKDIVTLSQNALKRLYEIISDSDKIPYLSLRVKGCNGYVYQMNMVDDTSLKEMDERIYDKTGKVVLAIENKAAFYLLGSKIDYTKDELSEGFTFDNPNVTSKCGCGMSFKF